MTRIPEPPIPTLAQRALELEGLKMRQARLSFRSGRALVFSFECQPSAYSRRYRCELSMSPDSRFPDMHVQQPDLRSIAGPRKIPHTYKTVRKGTRLCLWWPKRREWLPQMRLSETYIPWTAEWLWYFEEWLISGEWAGGGEHPDPRPRRWGGVRP
ncbi:hypothetical protein D3C87_1428680 [compost metagenome]